MIILHLLGQAFAAYDLGEGPKKESYSAYVFHIDQTTLGLHTATISRGYIEELCNGAGLSQNLTISQSEYDLLEPDNRKEALEVIVGLCKTLLDRGA